MELTSHSTWVAGGAIVISLMGSLLAFNTAQTTVANNQAVLALELKKAQEDLINYIDRETFVINDRITRFESDVEKHNDDVESRLRKVSEDNSSAVARAERNETIIKLLAEGKLP